jgi:hypothetical protein
LKEIQAMRRHALLIAALLALLAAAALQAQVPVKLDGYLQFWYLYEQAENGKLQPTTGDPGAQAASGFSLNRARLQTSLDLGAFKAVLQFRLEGGSVGLLDAYGSWQPFGPALELRAGQMKIPSRRWTSPPAAVSPARCPTGASPRAPARPTPSICFRPPPAIWERAFAATGAGSAISS